MATEKQKKAGKDFGLNLKQSKFCEIYATSEEFFANGAQSYIEVYSLKSKPITYKTALANASRLLVKANVLEYINLLLELRGLNDTFVDKQLELLITQGADFKSKLGAIKEYNNLKKRVDKDINIVIPKPILDVISPNNSNEKDSSTE
ncbi:MAG TPA: hypothetical protein ENI66_00520 [Candidatus Yonathbacteria bacterium]|nr:hypothetical protein [Candidatus Yonathbacteria bacterium]